MQLLLQFYSISFETLQVFRAWVSAVRTACDIQIDGRWGTGRSKLTWKKLTEKDCHEWKLTAVDPQERSTWRTGVRSAMRATSQLPGRGPTDVDDAPAG